MALRKKWQQCFKTNPYEKHVEMPGQIENIKRLVVVALYLISNNEILKSASSEHAKHMICHHEAGWQIFNRQTKMIFRLDKYGAGARWRDNVVVAQMRPTNEVFAFQKSSHFSEFLYCWSNIEQLQTTVLCFQSELTFLRVFHTDCVLNHFC